MSLYRGGDRGATHSIYNLNYSIPKNIAIVFHNESNYVYHFMIRELVEEFENQFTCLGENSEKYITFSIPIQKEVIRTDKNGENLQNNYLTDYNLLILQCSWQAHYQMLSIISLKELITLNVNMDTMIKKMQNLQSLI